MRFAISGFVFLSLITGCSNSSNSSDGSNGGSSNLSGTYKFESNGCSTGDHVYSSIQEYCQELQDEVLNKGCAYDLRLAEIKLRCTSTSVNTPPPTPPTPPPALPPNPPAQVSCFKADDAAPKGPEISLEAFADGSDRSYRMVSMTGMIQVNFKPQQMSLKVLTTSSTVTNEAAAAIVLCKEMSDAPDGSMEGDFKVPGEIRRDGGVIVGGVRANFKQYGKDSGRTNSVDGFKSEAFDFSTLTQFVEQTTNAQGALHIYQMADGSVQLVISGQAKVDSKTSDTLISAIYKQVATPPLAPAPQPTPAPAPTPPPAPAYDGRATVEKICQGYTYTSDQVNCLLKFKNVSIPKEVEACTGYTYVSDQAACAVKLSNKYFAPGIKEICSGFTYTSDQISCLQKLADIQVSETQVRICSGYTYASDQMACILKFK